MCDPYETSIGRRKTTSDCRAVNCDGGCVNSPKSLPYGQLLGGNGIKDRRNQTNLNGSTAAHLI